MATALQTHMRRAKRRNRSICNIVAAATRPRRRYHTTTNVLKSSPLLILIYCDRRNLLLRRTAVALQSSLRWLPLISRSTLDNNCIFDTTKTGLLTYLKNQQTWSFSAVLAAALQDHERPLASDRLLFLDLYWLRRLCRSLLNSQPKYFASDVFRAAALQSTNCIIRAVWSLMLKYFVTSNPLYCYSGNKAQLGFLEFISATEPTIIPFQFLKAIPLKINNNNHNNSAWVSVLNASYTNLIKVYFYQILIFNIKM